MHTLHSRIPIYPGDPPFASSCATCVPKDGYAVAALSLGSHSGTHIDAPAHFLENVRTVDQLALDELVGRAVVLDLTSIASEKKAISKDELQEALERSWLQAAENRKMPMLLIHTGWSRYWDSEDKKKYYAHPFLSRGAAEYILEQGFKVLGVDTLSPDETRLEDEDEGDEDAFIVHMKILGADGIIAENLTNLSVLGDGEGWTVHLVPLKIENCDGSPVRAFATRD
uniref:Cyclase n=1 Tax=Mycena chlorophos TaxID=658473 RepID=A0ABQ0LZP4_MYCCL|nr:predicted protein [Mycena chlorophos]